MKKIYFLTFLVLLSFQSFAQISINLQNLSNFQFTQKKNALNNMSSDIQRLNETKSLLKTYAMTSLQVKSLADLFKDDYSRLEFAKSAYQNVLDKNNFYEVYDAFMYFSTVFMLHDYVKGLSSNTNNGGNDDETPTELTFPNLNYPSISGYTGKKHCSYPMNDHDFHLFAADVAELGSENTKSARLAEIAQGHCMTTAQAMKFSSLLKIEANKLTFLKQAYLRAFDAENFKTAIQMFAYNNNKNNLLNYINTQVIDDNTNDTPVCEVTEAEFLDVRNRIKKESSSARLNMAKYLIKNKKCYTSAQIKNLVKIFSFDKDRMIVIKYAYDYTIDKNNFYIIKDALTFSSAKEDFMKFLNSKEGE